MSVDNKIKLNFLPLEQSKFTFKVWRKIFTNIPKPDGVQKRSLPKNNNNEERENYWVSFEQKEGYEEFLCKSEYNNYLNIDYIFHLLKIKTKKNFSENENIIEEKIRKRIYFVLKHHEYGDETVWLEPYYFYPERIFGFLINYKFRVTDPKNKNMREVLRLSLSLDKNYRSNRNYYLDKFDKIQTFLKNFKDRVFPLEDDFQNLISINTNFQELNTKQLTSKEFIFANQQKSPSQFKGISSFGPLKELENSVTFFYIFPKVYENLALDLKQALKGELYGIMFNGLSQVFRLEIEDEIDCIIDDYSEVNLQKAISEIINFHTTNPGKLVLPIFIEDKNNETAYYNLKYHLLKYEIPVQSISYQLLGRRDQFKWSASNLALQIFVKLGGIPWKVNQKTNSLIFGLSQSHKFIEGKIVKYYAYSVCTDSSGIYKKINILGNSDDEQSYLIQFKTQLISAINNNLDESFSKCIIHVSYKIKTKELICISDAINTLKNTHSEIEFIVIRINTEHSFFGFANTNSLIPYEGTYVTIKNEKRQYLLWVDGLQISSTISQQIQDPVFIEFYWSSCLLDEDKRTEILQEILNMSGSGWRGFNPSKTPISIKYCQLLSSYLKEFPAEVDNLEKITVPWFL